jgi:hypothetical protein
VRDGYGGLVLHIVVPLFHCSSRAPCSLECSLSQIANLGKKFFELSLFGSEEGGDEECSGPNFRVLLLVGLPC